MGEVVEAELEQTIGHRKMICKAGEINVRWIISGY